MIDNAVYEAHTKLTNKIAMQWLEGAITTSEYLMQIAIIAVNLEQATSGYEKLMYLAEQS